MHGPTCNQFLVINNTLDRAGHRSLVGHLLPLFLGYCLRDHDWHWGSYHYPFNEPCKVGEVVVKSQSQALTFCFIFFRPKAKTSQSGDVVVIEIKRGLDFPGAEYIEDKLQSQADKGVFGFYLYKT